MYSMRMEITRLRRELDELRHGQLIKTDPKGNEELYGMFIRALKRQQEMEHTVEQQNVKLKILEVECERRMQQMQVSKI